MTNAAESERENTPFGKTPRGNAPCGKTSGERKESAPLRQHALQRNAQRNPRNKTYATKSA